jgi:hypothetical protein
MSNSIVRRSLRMSTLFLVALLLLTLAGSRAVRADIFSTREFTSNGQLNWVTDTTALTSWKMTFLSFMRRVAAHW